MSTSNRIKYFSQQDLKKVFNVISNQKDKLMFLLIYRKALRVSELIDLKRADIDFERMKLYVERKKNSISGEHMLLPDEKRMIKHYLSKRKDALPYLFVSNQLKPYSRHYLNRKFQKYVVKAEVPLNGRSIHSMRHSLGVHLSDAGTDLLGIQSILGHRNIQNTLVYTNISNQRRDLLYERALRSGKII